MIEIPQISLPDLSHLQIDFDEIHKLHQAAVNSIDWDMINNAVRIQEDAAREAEKVTKPILKMIERESERTARMMAPFLEQMREHEELARSMMKGITPTLLGFDVDESEEDFVERISIVEADEEYKSTNALFPFVIPKLKSWDGLSLQFSGDKHVEITFPGFNGILKLSYVDMNCVDKRNGKPDSQWALLKILASLQGSVTWKDKSAAATIKKSKQALKRRLIELFGVEEDPFHRYTKKEGYRVKFILMPMDKPYGL